MRGVARETLAPRAAARRPLVRGGMQTRRWVASTATVKRHAPMPDVLSAERPRAAPAADASEPAPLLSGLACMALAVLCFSLMAVCVKVLGQGIPAHEKIFVRTAVTIPVLL